MSSAGIEIQSATPQQCVEVLNFFEAHRVPVWLHGGWALEAITGSSRSHSDIDLITWEDQRESLRTIIPGGIIKERSHKVRAAVFGVIVDIVFVTKGRSGDLLTFHPDFIMRWPKDVFKHSTEARLDDVAVPVVSPLALLVEISHTMGKDNRMLEKNASDRRRFGGFWPAGEHRRAREYFPFPNTWLNRLRFRWGI